MIFGTSPDIFYTKCQDSGKTTAAIIYEFSVLFYKRSIYAGISGFTPIKQCIRAQEFSGFRIYLTFYGAPLPVASER